MDDISQGSEVTQDTGTTDTSGQGQQVQPQNDNPFLSTVDEAHRPIVAPYLQKWDADVTRRFQELHSQYEPYKSLGDIEELNYARNIYDQINADPQAFLTQLQAAIEEANGEQGSGGTNGNGELPFQGLPPEFQTEYQQTRQAVEAMAQFMLDQQNSVVEQQQDQELDQLLSNLHQSAGDFDEDFVLTKMLNGMSPEQAVQSWHNAVQQFVNQSGGVQQRSGPRVLSGGGSVPQEQQRVTDLSRKDTKNLVADIMARSLQE